MAGPPLLQKATLDYPSAAMSDYLISPPTATDLQIDPMSFIQEVHKRWPNTQVPTELRPSGGVRCRLMFGSARLDVTLVEPFHTIALDGYPEECALFSLWYRTFVPAKYPLLLYDQGLNHEPIELRTDTTQREIIEGLMS